MARDFSGTSQYITYPSVAVAGSCSLSCWIFADTWNNAGNDSAVTGVFGKGTWGGDANGDVRITQAGDFLRAQVNTSGGDKTAESAVDRSGAWHQVGLVHDETADTLVLYVDGVAITTTSSVTGTLSNNAAIVAVGAYPNNLENTEFNGRIAECAIWNGVALTAGQMLSLGKGFSPAFYKTGLVFYIPLVGKSSTESDLRGGLSGTITGATAADHPRIYYPGIVGAFSQEAAPLVETPTHRLTETFLEVLYRDPLVASAARLTEEFLEVPYHAELTALADGPRLTQQTVEILYLEPEADPIFSDCGQFAGLREWEVRIYDHQNPAIGNRKAFGPDGYDLQRFVRELNFELQERGGYGGGSCEFDALWDEVDLDGTERVDVYLWDAPAYRGYLRIAQRNLASPESASPHFYGMVALLDQWQVKRKYAYGCATDVVTIARDIALDYVQIAGRFPSISLDMSTTVGATLKEFDGRGKSVAQCFNELADMAPNQTIWGAEMDAATPVPGDTLYFRPRPTAVAYVVPVGDNVEALIYPVDTHEITNSIKITGGDVAQPNLAPNGSFEEVMPASEDWGNLLIDHDFEAGNSGGQWQLLTGSGSDASLKQNGSAGAFGSGRSGEWWGELDTANEEMYQEVDIIAGRKYEASVWCRLEQAGFANTGTLYLEGRTSAGVLVVSVNELLTGLTATYQRFTVDLDLASYLTVTKLRYRVVGDGGTATNDGILIDDCGVYEYCSVAQQYWEVDTVGNATLADLDWDYDGAVDARTGEYMVMVDAANIALSSDYVQIYNRVVHAPSVDANERYTLLVWWHTAGLGTPGADALSIGAVSINSSGVQGTTFQTSTYSIAAGPPSTFDPATQCAQLAITTESTTAKLQLFARVRTNTVVYIDDVMLVKGEIPEEVLSYRGYWPADTYERYIDVSDALLVGDYALDAGVSTSITTYGHHQAEVSNELVTDQASALAFAAGQFNAKALPKVEASLNIYGARKLIFNEGKVRIVNLPSNLAALWPARSNYTITGEAIICRVELGNQRPDLQALLQLTAERARA